MAGISAHKRDNLELSPELHADLLDPGGWSDVLETFAHTMRLGVALTDSEGHQLGACHNPQPLWTLAREARPQSDAGCPFCVSPRAPCTAVREAIQKGEIVWTTDGAGLTHVAIPLSLNGRYLAGLVAGQVFDRYPESLRLERVAKKLGIPPQRMWQVAVRQTPVSRITLGTYGKLLQALGQAVLRERYGAAVEEKLKETNERFRLLIESLKEHAIFTSDSAGRITSWNSGAERLLGYTAAEITGRACALLFTPEDVGAQAPARDLHQALRDGAAETERWHVRKDGSRFLAISTLALVRHADGIEFGYIIRDITERRAAEAAMLEMQKQESIGVLASGVAHDFNNLLQGILINASMLLDDAGPLAANRQALEDIISAGGVAAGLTAQLLTYAGKGSHIPTRTNISELAGEILRLIHPSLRKGIDLQQNLAKGLPWVSADTSQIQQIVMNLLINAGEAIGPEGGTVRLTTGIAGLEPWQNDSPYVYFEVQDSGAGMDAATRARIFDPFFTTKCIGRGLGLAAVLGIVRAHKGKLEVRSAPGEGSAFRVILPALEPEEVCAKAQPRARGAKSMR